MRLNVQIDRYYQGMTDGSRTSMGRQRVAIVLVFAVVTVMFIRLPPMVAKQDSILGTYGALIEVDALTRHRYVEPVISERLVGGAIQGMLRQLDPYSGYISAGEMPAYLRRHGGEYVGLGLEVAWMEGRPVLMAPVEGGPASRAGLLAGDEIISINGKDAERFSAFEVDQALADEGRPVTSLVVRRAPSSERLAFDVVRGLVSPQTVRGWSWNGEGWNYLLDRERRTAYVWISAFNGNTSEQLLGALEEIKSLGVKGLVLDLRFNPGGLLEEGVRAVDLFLEEGLIVSTINRRTVVHEYSATAGEVLEGTPIVVLVNGYTASTAEIVAGSLQDHRRALVVGERTFGKGSVQHLIRLNSTPAAIKLTVAHYRLPSGRRIHRDHRARRDLDDRSWGILPDVVIALTENERQQVQERRRNLGARSPRETGVRELDASLSDRPGVTRWGGPADRQLEEALDRLDELKSVR